MKKKIADEEFEQFDIITDCSDHQYYNSVAGTKGKVFTDAGSKVSKKIMREWSILRDGLPQTIFVRVYEGRIDLLRAVIIGPKGTPYHDGLFFFDIAFPSDYPNRPPSVYYHAHGLTLNPNLYGNGYVCLSLINTWRGHGNEKWVPSMSTILQVLVSLQGIVLNEKPYFNEPGRRHGQWQEYNANVFILSCKTMLYHLRNPLKGFKDFVMQHFRNRASAILTACEAYRDGYATVGFTIEKMSSTYRVTPSFKEALEKIYKDLEKEFKENGIVEPKQVEVEEKEKIQRGRALPEKGKKSFRRWRRSTGLEAIIRLAICTRIEMRWPWSKE